LSVQAIDGRKLRFNTIAVRGCHDETAALNSFGAMGEPLHFGPAQHFVSAEAMRAALCGESEGWIYGRLGNPTVDGLERVLAALEAYECGLQAEAAAVASGMAAVFLATNPFLTVQASGVSSANIVASAACYGGTFNLFQQRYQKERGIEIRWVRDPLSLDDWAARIDAGTRLLYVEMPSNPALAIVDVHGLSQLGTERDLPVIVDATVATPAVFRPLQAGADIVLHSTKYMAANGLSLGGVLVAKCNIRSRVGPPSLRENFARYVKKTALRDIGCIISPFNALMTLVDLRGLRGRVDRMSLAGAKVAAYLAKHPAVTEVLYPGLSNHPGHKIAARDMVLVDSDCEGKSRENRFGSLISFRPLGGAAGAAAFLDRLKIFWRANMLGLLKSTATIPAIATHQQLSEAERVLASVPPDLVRISVGEEAVDDLLADLEFALAGVR
jgi:O-acetylhomoserine/O-acetylserine sulfhydrylase-like pyridoxal-dependent enzyme